MPYHHCGSSLLTRPNVDSCNIADFKITNRPIVADLKSIKYFPELLLRNGALKQICLSYIGKLICYRLVELAQGRFRRRHNFINAKVMADVIAPYDPTHFVECVRIDGSNGLLG